MKREIEHDIEGSDHEALFMFDDGALHIRNDPTGDGWTVTLIDGDDFPGYDGSVDAGEFGSAPMDHFYPDAQTWYVHGATLPKAWAHQRA